MDDLSGRDLYEVGTPRPLDDLAERLGRGEEAVPAVSSACSSRHPAGQVGELVRLCRSLTGASGSADIRRSCSSADWSSDRRPKRVGKACQAAQ